MKTGTSQRLMAVLLLVGLLLPLLSSAPEHAGASAAPQNEAGPRADIMQPHVINDRSSGLTILLSEGSPQAADADQMPVTAGEPLSEDEAAQILDRLPPLEPETGDVVEFRLPEKSLPPPKTGEVIETIFPAEEEAAPPERTEVGPLEVLRYAPEGEIPLAPFLNVTFSQPMVPLATLDELSSADVPVVLTPELPGVWKWLGTKTLSFEYRSDEIDRFPMATEYNVEIPAGTTSAIGGVLAEPVAWSLRTPPPNMIASEPAFGPQPRDPLLFIAFDQRIDPEAMLAAITASAQRQSYALRLADESEIAADERIQRLVDSTPEGRWLAFHAVETFPANTTVNVAVNPGAPSAEGPLVTTEAQTFSFQTYAPLRIEESRCGYYGNECPPFSSLSIVFNNPLDSERFDSSLLTVEPAIDGMVVRLYGNSIEIEGATLANTVYKVTVGAALQDIFGQTLGEDQTVTFHTTAAPSYLTGPDYFVTLDPSSTTPVFTVHSVNYPRLNVSAYAVEPEDWPAYTEYMRTRNYDENPPDPPGKLVMSESIEVDGPEGQIIETAIDLRPLLNGETGHLILVVETPSLPVLSQLLGRREQRVIAWTQVTQIGLDAISDHSELTAWATALQDGAPLADVELSLLPENQQATTDADGIALFKLRSEGNTFLTGSLGDDVAILPASSYYWDETGWQRRPVSDSLFWYVFDDRQMYRPGEEVHVKGWMRRVGGKQEGDVGLPQTQGVSVRYRLIDARGNEVLDGVAEVNDLAGFDMAFSLPDNMNLGYARLELQAEGLPDFGDNLDPASNGRPSYDDAPLWYTHSFQVQEFRRPEFEVSAGNESEGPFFVGDEAVVSVSATYFAGGPLPNAETFWVVSSSPGSYSPPNWPDFIFGEWQPWWRYYETPYLGSDTQTYEGRTDAAGRHYLQMDFVDAEEPRPYSVIASADVMDVNRQAWNSSTSLLVHPSELYVGLRSERTFVEQGEPMVVEAIVTDLDGSPVEGRQIELSAARLEWNYGDGEWRQQEADAQPCTVTSAQEPVTCSFDTTTGGEYRITAVVMDDRERANRTRFTRWVSGGERPPARNVEQESVELIPDKEEYQPGDVAEILVQAPFAPAEGLLTVARSGILYTEPFSMEDGSYTLRVPIEDGHIPNLSIQVDLAGSAPRINDDGQAMDDVPSRPAFATGSVDLAIPPLSRALMLEIVPEETELAPGSVTSIDLTLTDAEGRSVAGGELAVVVVDEAILALTGYELVDPLAVFYRSRPADTRTVYARNGIVLDNPERLVAEEKQGGSMGGGVATLSRRATLNSAVVEAASMDMAEESMAIDDAMPAMAMAAAPAPTPSAQDGSAASPIEVRADFNPLAVFAPDVRTDAEGRARIDVTLPDNLTRYRIMVVAVAGGKQFGSAESNMTARLPLMVRPSAPRFLNFGDSVELPVVLQNQTDEEMAVEVVAQVANLALTEDVGLRVTVPANDRVEVRFPAETENAGTARVRFAAVSDPLVDAAEVEMPVYTPATTEAFATYGVVDEDVADGGAVVQPVSTPRDVFPQFGGLEVNTSSTALQSLTDAVLYLTTYPFDSSAQLASRILGVGALRDVLSAFDAEELPSPAEMNVAVERDIAQLQGMQNYDGGFPVWQRGKESQPFNSVHVAHALAVARAKDYLVPQEMVDRSLDYLRNIENYYPSWYGKQTKHALSAYALYVRQLLGDVDTAKAGRLLTAMPLEEQGLEAVAWLWQVLGDDPSYADETAAISRYVNNSAVETPGAANFITSYGDDEWVMLHSNRRTDGIVLDALIGQEPESDLIPKVVNGLLAHRTQGRWNNTQENVFILLALDRYFNTFEAETPDFVARIWLGEAYVGEHGYKGYSTDSHATVVPMTYLIDSEEETQDLILAKDGDGRLYYRLGMRYAPDDLVLDALDMGFVVQRTYEAIDDPDDVVLDEDGVWRIKAGAEVRVVLKMVADSRRYHVALVDPLPAGLEIVNPDLAVSGERPEEPGRPEPYRWWWGPWYQHQNLRDHQAEAFTTQLWDGVYDYAYTARATTPGRFVVPPAKAEEMYSPEVFGRSGSDVVVVE